MDSSQLQNYLCGKLVEDYNMIDQECGLATTRQQIINLIDNAKLLILEGNTNREERRILLERLSAKKSRWLKKCGGREYHRERYSSVDQIQNERRLVSERLVGTRKKRDRSGLRHVISNRYRFRVHRFRKALAEHNIGNQILIKSSALSSNSEAINTSTGGVNVNRCIIS